MQVTAALYADDSRRERNAIRPTSSQTNIGIPPPGSVSIGLHNAYYATLMKYRGNTGC